MGAEDTNEYRDKGGHWTGRGPFQYQRHEVRDPPNDDASQRTNARAREAGQSHGELRHSVTPPPTLYYTPSNGQILYYTPSNGQILYYTILYIIQWPDTFWITGDLTDDLWPHRWPSTLWMIVDLMKSFWPFEYLSSWPLIQKIIVLFNSLLYIRNLHGEDVP